MRRLTGPELERARDALVSAYYTYDHLEQLAAFSLDLDLQVEVGGPGQALREIAFKLLKLTEANGLTELLLQQALARRSGNAALKAMCVALAIAPAPFQRAAADAGDEGYEARVARISGLQPTAAWHKQMVERENRVCQILRDGKAIGTGFLVGPDLVMSNWHVFETARGSGLLGDAGDYAALFDYRGAPGHAPADPGLTIAFDRASGFRDASHLGELDYVIVSLDRRIGDEPLPGHERRGWLQLGTRNFDAGDTTLILQHPAGRTLESAFGPILGWRAGRAREIYEHRADTEEGSSGSPCFAMDWALLAIHHRVDPVTGDRNRAIATTAILERMGNLGTIGLLPALG